MPATCARRGHLENTGLARTPCPQAHPASVPRGHIGAAYRYYDNTTAFPAASSARTRRVSTWRCGATRARPGAHRPARSVRSAASSWTAGTRTTTTASSRRRHHRDGVRHAHGQRRPHARHDGGGRSPTAPSGGRLGWQDYAAGGGTETPPSQEWSAAVFALEELDVGRARYRAGAPGLAPDRARRHHHGAGHRRGADAHVRVLLRIARGAVRIDAVPERGGEHRPRVPDAGHRRALLPGPAPRRVLLRGGQSGPGRGDGAGAGRVPAPARRPLQRRAGGLPQCDRQLHLLPRDGRHDPVSRLPIYQAASADAVLRDSK
jgi:hypothetical protein